MLSIKLHVHCILQLRKDALCEHSLNYWLPDPVKDYEDRLADYMVRMDDRLVELEETINKLKNGKS